MKPVYIQEYIWRSIRDLMSDKAFIIQGLHMDIHNASKKDQIDLQWLLSEYNQQVDDMVRKLKAIDLAVDKINKKGEMSAHTEI